MGLGDREGAEGLEGRNADRKCTGAAYIQLIRGEGGEDRGGGICGYDHGRSPNEVLCEGSGSTRGSVAGIHQSDQQRRGMGGRRAGLEGPRGALGPKQQARRVPSRIAATAIWDSEAILSWGGEVEECKVEECKVEEVDLGCGAACSSQTWERIQEAADGAVIFTDGSKGECLEHGYYYYYYAARAEP